MFEGLVESLHETFGLCMVVRHFEMSDLQQSTQVCHEAGNEGVPLSISRSLGILTKLNRSISSLVLFFNIPLQKGTACGYHVA